MTNKETALSGFVWKFAERCGAQGVQFIVSIILARLLSPNDYGLIGLITVFIAIAQVFTHSGLGIGLVQKKDSDNLDFSTVFYFSMGFSVILYFILFFAAPYIAAFYNEELLTDVVRVLSLSVIISGLHGIQITWVQKTMQFKKFFISTLAGTFVSAVLSVYLAYNGYGVWALVWQQLSGQIINTIILRAIIDWKPQLCFSFKRLKTLFSFGWKMLCSVLIDTFYNNIYSLVIGKIFSPSDLGYYSRGKQFPHFIINNINSSIDSVMFPVFAKVQDEQERLKNAVRRTMLTSTFIIFPIMALLSAIAKPLTVVFLTDKWLPAVPFIQYCCITYALLPIQTANLQAIKALGRSDIYLKLEVAKKVIGFVILLVTIPFGLNVMMIGQCVGALCNSIINIFPNRKLLNYSISEQIRDICPAILLSLIMAALVNFINYINCLSILKLIIQCITGIIIYLGLAKLFKLEPLSYIFSTISEITRKKTK